MAPGRFGLASTSQEIVLRALQATGSTDPDVLFAAKREFGTPFAKQKLLGLALYLVGALITIRLLLAPLGITMALFGLWLWRRGRRSLATIEAAHDEYLRAIDRTRAATTI
jgi:hypothetical protein